MAEKQNSDEGYLRSIFWPSINSKKDAADQIQVSSSIIAAYFVLSNLLIGFLSENTYSVIFSIIFAGAACAVWYKNVYWLGFIIGCEGLQEHHLYLSLRKEG